ALGKADAPLEGQALRKRPAYRTTARRPLDTPRSPGLGPEPTRPKGRVQAPQWIAVTGPELDDGWHGRRYSKRRAGKPPHFSAGGRLLPPQLPVALLLHGLLLRGVLDDDELLLVGVVGVFLIIGQHRELDAVGLALLDDHVHELLVRLGLLAVERL